jgi:hypothetical protein
MDVQRAEVRAALYVENRNPIIQRAGKPEPYIYGVYARRLEKLFPRD